MKKIRLSRFTLVEILAVIGIMAILLYVAVPSFTRLARGGGAEYGARMLIAKIGQARGAAIYNRQNIAIVFYMADAPAGGDSPEGNTRRDKYFNKSFRLCEVGTTASGQYYFKRWLQDETWNFLTPGVAVLQINQNSTISDIAATPPNFNSQAGGIVTQIFYDSSCGANKYLPGIVFKPSGVSTADRYVHIGEGTCTGGNLTVTNKNPDAYVTISVSRYTGRVSYGKE